MVCYNTLMQPGDSEEPHNPAPEEQQNETPVRQADQIDAPGDQPSSWDFHNEDGAGSSNQAPGLTKPISWTASEYVAHPKTILWFIGVGGVVAALTVIIYLITKDLVSAVVMAVIGMTFGAFAARNPQVLEYGLDETGLHIGSKLYPYERFKSFSIMQEGAIRSILLMPLQRFMPPLTVYYDPEDEDKIIKVLGTFLPAEERSHDPIDRLMRKIRF